MRKIMMMSLAAALGLSQAAYAESQNPHDPSNQASEMDTDIHADTDINADTNTGSTGSVTPNPNSLGRTGRLRDSNDLQRNQGVQTVPSNPDNISDRIENSNDTDRNLHDRLDGRQSPTVDPAVNSDRDSATPVIPPGQGPGVTTDTGAADTGTDSSATSRSDAASGASARPGSRAVSGSGSANGSGSSGSGSTGGSAGAGSGSSSGSSAGGR
jgi:hypothetical protein